MVKATPRFARVDLAVYWPGPGVAVTDLSKKDRSPRRL